MNNDFATEGDKNRISMVDDTITTHDDDDGYYLRTLRFDSTTIYVLPRIIGIIMRATAVLLLLLLQSQSPSSSNTHPPEPTPPQSTAAASTTATTINHCQMSDGGSIMSHATNSCINILRFHPKQLYYSINDAT